MEYKRFGDAIFVKICKGEEVIEQVKALAAKEGIKLASVQALGAIGDFTVGVFNAKEKKFCSNDFQGDFEIVSLTGTIDRMDGEPYCHLHMSAANDKGDVFGGHLSKAVVSVICEMVVRVIDGGIGRRFDEEIGLNVWEF